MPDVSAVPLSYRIVTLQLVTALSSAAVLLLVSVDQALAALAAGVVCILPGGHFAWRAERERSPGRMLGQGVVKFVMTLVLMVLTFAWIRPSALGFFATFGLMQAMYVLVPLKWAGKSSAR
jgi:F0F1-type ATP synthase assembly protein I